MGRGKKNKNKQQQQQTQQQQQEETKEPAKEETAPVRIVIDNQEEAKGQAPDLEQDQMHPLMGAIDRQMESKMKRPQTAQITSNTLSTDGLNNESTQPSTAGTPAMTKNQKKKQAKKKNQNKKELIDKMKERNISSIKCPKDLDDKGFITELNDIALGNKNKLSKYNLRGQRSPSNSQGSSSKSSSSDDDDHDVEEIEDYGVDGYHACHVGEIIDSKYVVLKKLGWGHFSTVWLTFKLSDKQLYALKIQKSAEKYIESAFEEEEILYDVALNFKNDQWQKFLRKHFKDEKLEATRDQTHNLQMFDQFFHHGLYGKHFIMAFEVLGKNLLSLIKKYDYRGVPLPIVRRICKQLLLGLDYMHRVCGIIHTDLKPENAVFGLTERQKFELLYEHVLCGPLIDLFETDQPIILNSKQLKNAKKKDRKKKKKQAEQQQNQEEKGEEDKKGDNSNMTPNTRKNLERRQNQQSEQQKSKTEQVVTEFSERIDKGEEKYKMVPIMEKRRNRSARVKRKSYQTIFEKQDADMCDLPMHTTKKHKRKFLRVNSCQRLDSESKQSDAYKPLSSYDVHQMKELDLQVKLCDMGNACYITKHYSDIIQTREYRSPEVILGGEYDQSADLWSLACMTFELVTGDYLFDPKKGKTFRKNDDHLALITELIGPCKDRNWLQSCSKVWKFYDKKKYKLKNITKLHEWPLYNVLLEKYRLKDSEATSLAKFLRRMLQWKPKDRVSARDLLSDPWLQDSDSYNVWMSREHLKEFKIVNHKQFPGFLDKLRKEKLKEESKIPDEGTSSVDRDLENQMGQSSSQENVEQNGSQQNSNAEESSSDDESSPYESGQSQQQSSSSGEEDDEDEDGLQQNDDDAEEWQDEHGDSSLNDEANQQA